MEKGGKIIECSSRAVEGVGSVDVRYEYAELTEPADNPYTPPQIRRVDELYTVTVKEGEHATVHQLTGPAMAMLIELCQRLHSTRPMLVSR